MHRVRNIKFIIPIVFLLYASTAIYAIASYLKEITFDNPHALDRWSKMILNGQVDYRVVKKGNESFVQAQSEKACSALYYRIGFKSKDYPVFTWKWRAIKFPDKSKASTPKERDDYAARVYVIFPFFNFSSSKFIEYVWDEKLPLETIMDSPSGGNVKQIVVRSGKPKDDQWAEESRNIYEDYIKAFGKKPGLNVGAVAIMCDADNTKSEAESLFGEMRIAK